jgi:hypothetical protein
MRKKSWLRLEGSKRIYVCTKRGRRRTAQGHDPCIANLPGVKNACCGHGIEPGYIQFENGITIRGDFEVTLFSTKENNHV